MRQRSQQRKIPADKRVVPQEPETMRLNKFIAHCGICSRREADELISRGEIKVNGRVVTALGTQVSNKDAVSYKGKELINETPVYILMNKPKGYDSTVEDPHASRTVLDLIGEDCRERIYPVGRLDRTTTGVLLLTNDGELTKKLTHPRYRKRKIYHVFLDKPLTRADLQSVASGMKVDEDYIQPDAIDFVATEDKSQIGIEIHSGQNRIIRRLFESMGYKIRKLDRVYFAGLTKKGLQRGQWRYLKDKEIHMLKMMAFK